MINNCCSIKNWVQKMMCMCILYTAYQSYFLYHKSVLKRYRLHKYRILQWMVKKLSSIILVIIKWWCLHLGVFWFWQLSGIGWFCFEILFQDDSWTKKRTLDLDLSQIRVGNYPKLGLGFEVKIRFRDLIQISGKI